MLQKIAQNHNNPIIRVFCSKLEPKSSKFEFLVLVFEFLAQSINYTPKPNSSLLRARLRKPVYNGATPHHIQVIHKPRWGHPKPQKPHHRKGSKMAIFRASTNHISRGKSHNVVAAAAYRAGEKLTDTNDLNPDATTHDYTKKKGVMATGIILPRSLVEQDFSIDRQSLWSSVEQHETTTRSVKGSRLKQTARLAREWLLALPSELSDEENEQLTAAFTQRLADDLNVIGDYCIHKPTRANYKPKKDYIESYDPETGKLELTRVDDIKATEPDQRNIHAHIMFTTRKAEIGAAGELKLGDKAESEISELNRQKKGLCNGGDYLKEVRAMWANMVNERLIQHEIAPITHKSYKDLGLDIMPQHKQGKNASVLALYSFKPPIVGFNNDIKERNRAVIESTADSSIAVYNDTANKADTAADATARAADAADKWLSRTAPSPFELSRAAPSPFDSKRAAAEFDEQTISFDTLAERANQVLARPIRPSAELIEQAIQKYWSIEEWSPTIQKSDWGGGGTAPNPEPDPSDAFNHRQQVVIENIDKHLSCLDGDKISSDTLRRTLADPANKQILTLLTDPEREQAEHEQGLYAPRNVVSVDEVPTVNVEPIPTNEMQQLPPEKPPMPRNVYRPR